MTNSQQTEGPVTEVKDQTTQRTPKGKVFSRKRLREFFSNYWIIALFVALAPIAFSVIFEAIIKKDDTALEHYKNAAIILGSLSAICFSWTRAIEEADSRNRAIVLEGGENFLRAAIFMLFALLLRSYAMFLLPSMTIEKLDLETIGASIAFLVSCIFVVYFALPSVLKGIFLTLLVIKRRHSTKKED